MSYSELCELIKRINNSLGFLGNFLEKFPIDFTYFKNINIPDIYTSARKSDEIFIEFGEEVISSCQRYNVIIIKLFNSITLIKI